MPGIVACTLVAMERHRLIAHHASSSFDLGRIYAPGLEVELRTGHKGGTALTARKRPKPPGHCFLLERLRWTPLDSCYIRHLLSAGLCAPRFTEVTRLEAARRINENRPSFYATPRFVLTKRQRRRRDNLTTSMLNSSRILMAKKGLRCQNPGSGPKWYRGIKANRHCL